MHQARRVILFCLLAFAGCSGSKDNGHDGSVVSTSTSAFTRTNNGPASGFTHVIAGGFASIEPSTTTSGSLDSKSTVESGIYSYAVPIGLPDGVAGLKPDLGLVYSSAGGNGAVGVGWAIKGLSAITRCAHNVASDGYAAGFDFMQRHDLGLNRYCLDGEKLVPVEKQATKIIYQTERANFARITGVFSDATAADPDSFVVEAKDGRTYSYGLDSDLQGTNSRALGPVDGAGTKPSLGAIAYAWHLAKIADRDGNTVQFRYLSDAGSDYLRANTTDQTWVTPGQTRYLYQVLYGNTAVQFNYEARPDPIEAFAFGFDLSMAQRLKNVEVSIPGKAPTWTYSLRYNSSSFTQRSELTSIQIKDQFGVSMPATTFRWNGGSQEGSAYVPSDYKITQYDLGGNCATNPANCLPRNSTRVILADFDGDGRDDAIYSLASTSLANSAVLKIRFGTATGLGPELDALSPVPTDTLVVYLDSASAADFDGDGKFELIWDYKVGNSPILHRVSRWTGSFFDAVPASGLKTLVQNWEFSWDDNRLSDLRGIRIADFNGDGVPDLMGGRTGTNYDGLPDYDCREYHPGSPGLGIACSKAPFQIFLADPARNLSYASTAIAGPAPAFNRTTLSLGDLDGDARADVLQGSSSKLGYLYADLNGDRVIDEIDVSGMEPGDCGALAIVMKIKANAGAGTPAQRGLGRTGMWRDAPYGYDYTKTILPSGRGTCSAINEPIANCPDPDDCEDDPSDPAAMRMPYGDSMRVGDFNGDGNQDLLLLNISLDAGTDFYRRSQGLILGETYDYQDIADGETIKVNRRYFLQGLEWGKGHFSAPVLLLSRGVSFGTGFDAVVLPVKGGRYREETYRSFPGFRDIWNGNSGHDSIWAMQLSGPWRSHFWNGTAVGDVDGDGLADVVQIVLAEDNASVKLETIIAKKTELGITNRKDVIVEVKNGLQSGAANGASVSEKIVYGELPSLLDASQYTRSVNCAAPTLSSPGCLTRGLLVDRFTPSGRPSTAAQISYGYWGARYDRKGRGFLGFDQVDARDKLFGVETSTYRSFVSQAVTLQDDFNADYWAKNFVNRVDDEVSPTYLIWNDGIPMPLQRRVLYPATVTSKTQKSAFFTSGGSTAGVPLSTVINITQNDLASGIPNGTTYTANNVFHVRPRRQDVSETYIAAASSGTQTATPQVTRGVDFTYDSYSNPKVVTKTDTVSGGTGAKDTVTTDYNNDSASWIIGQPKSVAHQRIFDTSSITRTTTYTYYGDGRPKVVTIEPSGGDDLKLTTTHSYNGNGTLKQVDVVGKDKTMSSSDQTRTTKYTYDAKWIYPATVSNALTKVTTLTYDPAIGQLIASVDANGLGTDYVYDGFGRKRGEFPDGLQATFTTLTPSTRTNEAYKASNYISVGAATGGDCTAASFSLNERCFALRQTAIVDIRSDTVRTSENTADNQWFDVKTAYDDRDRMSSRTQLALDAGTPPVTTYEYDGLDRLTKVRNPDAVSSKIFAYPTYFQLVTTDEVDSQITYTKDVVGVVVQTDERLKVPTLHSVTTQFVHDAFGNVTKSTRKDGSGGTRVSNYGYDTLGRRTSADDPTAGATTKSYNAFGEARKEGDALSARDLKHDALGRLTKSTDANDSTRYESYTWDTGSGAGIGKLGSAKSMPDNVERTYSYSSGNGQLSTSQMTVAGSTNSYGMTYLRDTEGRVTNVSYPYVVGSTPPVRSMTVKYVIGSRGFLQRVERTQPVSDTVWTQNSSNPLSSVETAGDGSVTQRLYDPATLRVTDLNVASGSSSWNLHYGYALDGQVTSKTSGASTPAVTESFSYDDMKRLTLWKHTKGSANFRREYGYNDFGDHTGTKTFNALANGTQTGSETFTMNVISPRVIPSAVSEASGDWSSTYTYDTMGRRIGKVTNGTNNQYTGYNHWDLPAGIVNPNTTLGFLYDPFGQRAFKSVVAGSTTTNIYYFDALFEDRVVSGVHTFVMHVPANGKPIAVVSRQLPSTTLTTKYVHQDLVDSTAAITSGSSPTTFLYEPFGARVGEDGVTGVNVDSLEHVDFGGHEHDELSIINMNGRLYNPSLRRFLTVDPNVSDPKTSQSYNPYSYAANNPINRSDPSGFDVSENGQWTPANTMPGGGGPNSGSTPAGGYNGADLKGGGSEVDTEGNRAKGYWPNSEPNIAKTRPMQPGNTTCLVPPAFQSFLEGLRARGSSPSDYSLIDVPLETMIDLPESKPVAEPELPMGPVEESFVNNLMAMLFNDMGIGMGPHGDLSPVNIRDPFHLLDGSSVLPALADGPVPPAATSQWTNDSKYVNEPKCLYFPTLQDPPPEAESPLLVQGDPKSVDAFGNLKHNRGYLVEKAGDRAHTYVEALTSSDAAWGERRYRLNMSMQPTPGIGVTQWGAPVNTPSVVPFAR